MIYIVSWYSILSEQWRDDGPNKESTMEKINRENNMLQSQLLRQPVWKISYNKACKYLQLNSKPIPALICEQIADNDLSPSVSS